MPIETLLLCLEFRCSFLSGNIASGQSGKNGFSFHFFLFQLVSLCSIVIQFAAIADRNMIIKDTKDPVTINLFSFIFAMGILVSFFKLMSDILVIYGAKKVSASRVACNMATI